MPATAERTVTYEQVSAHADEADRLADRAKGDARAAAQDIRDFTERANVNRGRLASEINSLTAPRSVLEQRLRDLVPRLCGQTLSMAERDEFATLVRDAAAGELLHSMAAKLRDSAFCDIAPDEAQRRIDLATDRRRAADHAASRAQRHADDAVAAVCSFALTMSTISDAASPPTVAAKYHGIRPDVDALRESLPSTAAKAERAAAAAREAADQAHAALEATRTALAGNSIEEA